MRINLEYRDPTPAHCDVAVFVNGGLAGVLRLRQEELADFHRTIRRGTGPGDRFETSGDPAWHDGPTQ